MSRRILDRITTSSSGSIEGDDDDDVYPSGASSSRSWARRKKKKKKRSNGGGGGGRLYASLRSILARDRRRQGFASDSNMSVSTHSGHRSTGTSSRQLKLQKRQQQQQQLLQLQTSSPASSVRKVKVSLLERVGGEATFGVIVDEFYYRVYTDETLKPFFAGLSDEKISSHQVRLLKMVFADLPESFDVGGFILEKHRHLFPMGLNETHFDAVAAHLTDTMKMLDLPNHLRDEVIANLLPFRQFFLRQSLNDDDEHDTFDDPHHDDDQSIGQNVHLLDDLGISVATTPEQPPPPHTRRQYRTPSIHDYPSDKYQPRYDPHHHHDMDHHHMDHMDDDIDDEIDDDDDERHFAAAATIAANADIPPNHHHESSLLHQIGGESILASIVDEFYSRLSTDKNLLHFFNDIEPDNFMTQQRCFLKMALTHLPEHVSLGLYIERQERLFNLGLNVKHFDACLRHFVETLREIHVPDHLTDDVVQIIRPLRVHVDRGAMLSLQKAARQTGDVLTQLGGDEVLTAAVSVFYKRVLADDTLALFFEGVDLNKLKAHQFRFMRMAFTEIPKGIDVAKYLIDRHLRLFALGLNETHFDAVARHLVGTLQAFGVSDQAMEEVLSIVGPLRLHFQTGAAQWKQARQQQQQQQPSSSSTSLTPQNTPSLLDQMGGLPVMTATIDAFHTRIISDSSLTPFLRGIDLHQFKEHQKLFLQFALTQIPIDATKSEQFILSHHEHLFSIGLNETHFDAAVTHMIRSLKANEVSNNVVNQALAIITPFRKYFEQGAANGKNGTIQEEDEEEDTETDSPLEQTTEDELEEQEKLTLLERLGGENDLKGFIACFTQKVLSDERLSHFFDGIDHHILLRHQHHFLRMVFTHIPKSFDIGEFIMDKHSGLFSMGLHEAHFDIFTGHMVDAMKQSGFNHELIDEAMDHIYPLRLYFEHGANMYDIALAASRSQQKQQQQQQQEEEEEQQTSNTPSPDGDDDNGKSDIPTSPTVKERRNSSLLERIGGSAVLKESIDEFYKRTVADTDLSRFFEGVELGALKAHQRAFLTTALTQIPKGLNIGNFLMERHERLFAIGLDVSHFDRTIEHLRDSLEYCNVPYPLIDEVVQRLSHIREYFDRAASRAKTKKNNQHQQPGQLDENEIGDSDTNEIMENDYFDGRGLENIDENGTGHSILTSETNYSDEEIQPLLDRMGGEKILGDVVDKFYLLATTEPTLSPFFQSVSLSRLKSHQRRFLWMLLSFTHQGVDLIEFIFKRHQHLFPKGLNEIHFDTMLNLFVSALKSANIRQSLIDEARERISRLRISFERGAAKFAASQPDNAMEQPSTPSKQKKHTRGSLYDRIGGNESLTMAIDLLYEWAVVDPILSPLIADIPAELLKAHQRRFLRMALTKLPESVARKFILEKHERVFDYGLNETHFDLVVKYFVDALEEIKVDMSKVDEVRDAVLSLRPYFKEGAATAKSRLPKSRERDKEASEEEKRKTLLERIGGNDALTSITDELSMRVIADEPLLASFDDASPVQVTNQVHSFMTVVFSTIAVGKNEYDLCKILSEEQEHSFFSRLDKENFDVWMDHLEDSLKVAGIDETLGDLLVKALSPFRENLKATEDRTADSMRELSSTESCTSTDIDQEEIPLFDRMGGNEVLQSAVDDFCGRVSRDVSLSRFFHSMSPTAFERHKIRIMKIVFQSLSTGVFVQEFIAKKHRRLFKEMGLNETHFDTLMGHVANALRSVGVRQNLIREALETVMPLRRHFENLAAEVITQQL